jgi:FixJ family two-component response regulator
VWWSLGASGVMFVEMGHVRGCPTGGALTSLVGVVDDDESGRAALSSLIRSAGYMCAVFPSAEAFLAAGGFAGPHCMILDVHMPGLSGLELQARLRQMKSPIPVIFITAHWNDETRQTALRGGAVAFFHKPFQGEALLDAIRSALDSAQAAES